MEVDWEIEIGGSAPVIDANWPGFVDLRANPERAPRLPETASVSALADALVRLNSPSSPVWTSKCEVWQPEIFDPDELDAPAGASNSAIACYIDLLPADNGQWHSPESAIEWSKLICTQLHCHVLRCCRADLIVRRAEFKSRTSPDHFDLGVTCYLTACGPTGVAAIATLSSALAVFAGSIAQTGFPEDAASTLQ